MITSVEYVGNAGSGTFTQSGGTNSVSFVQGEGGTASSISAIDLGAGGTYNLTGSGMLSSMAQWVGYSGTGSFTQSGGTNSVQILSLAYASLGGGIYNFEGGLLNIEALNQGSGLAIFNFSGGTLQAACRFATNVPMILGASSGCATFDAAGYAVTLSGSLSGPGSLTTVDGGTLSLAASNSYTGTTTITAGVLSLANSAALAGGGNITFAGGTLQYTSSNSLDYSGKIAGSASPISIDTNGVNVTFASSLVSSNVGGLTKIGSGTLDLDRQQHLHRPNHYQPGHAPRQRLAWPAR